MSTITCSECGHQNTLDSSYCDNCGMKLPVIASEEKSSTTIVSEVDTSVVSESESSPELEVDTSVVSESESSSESEVDTSVVSESESSSELEVDTSVVSQSESSPESEVDTSVVSESESSSELEVDTSVVSQSESSSETDFEKTEEDIGSKLEEAWVAQEEKDEMVNLETTTPVSPIESSVSPQITPIRPNEPTRLDFDEPEPEPEPQPIKSPPTTLDIREPILSLIHLETNAKFVLPSKKETVYIGRINDEIPVDIDLSGVPDADVISRVHCTIHMKSQNYYLEDAGSINGTFLNDKEIKTGARYRSQLQSGDAIILGKNRQLKFTFHVEE